MKAVCGSRVLPCKREVDKVLRYLQNPKTIIQIATESHLDQDTVASAIRILAAKHLVIEVDSDPELYLAVRA